MAPFAIFADRIAASGLVSEDDWKSVLAVARQDSTQLALELTTRGLLTPYQIAAFAEGRAESLRVGNYDIVDRLGAGGMGTVFKARHRRMKRMVALKILKTELSRNPTFVARFQREVETIASLGHPNVVMAYDADEAEVGHFLVMEFVQGVDLAAQVERAGPLPLAMAVDCILQAARGLAYAHSQGIVHRDVKPHNLLRDHKGVVKVTDLGLARLQKGGAGSEVTLSGGVIGTADYMPPEQAVDSTSIDHRADIYSLGCTLYYLLAGKPPFLGSSIMAILLQHRDAPVPTLRQVRPETPSLLDDLFRRMLAKHPEQRIQQMSEVVTELEATASSIPPLVGSPRDSRPLSAPLPPCEPPGSSSSSTQPVPSETLVMEAGVERLTVLLVEPSRVQSAIIKSYVQEHSLTVVGTAATGSQAVESVRTLRPRAVVSAMHLPDMDGLQLASQIRSEVASRAPGFVLVTSDTSELNPTALAELNRVMLLPKPFTSLQLLAALNQVTGASMHLPSLGWPAENASSQGGRIDRGRLRVMIVDDSGTARSHVRTVLQALGFSEFSEFPDGAHAIAAAGQERCDLIVTDYNMPLMDGRALVSYLKQTPATSAIPIVMVTSETDPDKLDPVRRLGVLAVVEKSFPANLVGKLLDAVF